jgi:ABC-type antimicrobial peptide transport system permease subunit
VVGRSFLYTLHLRAPEKTMSTAVTARRLGLFAGLGTMLAVIGVYGIVAYLVAQRTRELGVRMALGAKSADIVWLVLRHGLLIGISGVAIGVTGAIAMRQVLLQYLFVAGPAQSSPLAIVGTAVAVLLAVGIASAAPARRAVRVDTVQALRSD